MSIWWDILKENVGYEVMGEGNDSFMVTDEIWNEANARREFAGEGKYEGYTHNFATIPDVEEGLGRRLTVDDFTPSPMNWVGDNPQILDRIGEQGRQQLIRKYLELPIYRGGPVMGQTLFYTMKARSILGEVPTSDELEELRAAKQSYR
tara:strand:+ start:66 stop:512 length:447 start_codon:yes stop_codon:yes gene_type:complete